MVSLARCIAKTGVTGRMSKTLNDHFARLRGDGYDGKSAAEESVQFHLDDLNRQRANIMAQLAKSSEVAEGSLLSHGYGDLSPDQQAGIDEVFGKPLTMRQKYDRMRANIGAKIEQGVFDQFAPLKKLSMKAYNLARLSKASDGALEAIMLFGNLSLLDGVTDSDASGSGFIEHLKKLKGEHHRFFLWVAANRAEKLSAQDRERLFSDKTITSLKTLNEGDMEDGTSREEAYREALDAYATINANILDLATESGIISPEVRASLEDEMYVPFYRAIEDGVTDGFGFGKQGGLVRQYAFKKLKGSDKHLNRDLLANVIMNWSHLLSASAKNRASTEALQAAEGAGVADRYPSADAAPKGAVWVLERGQKVYYDVHDDFILDAITSLDAKPVGGAAGQALAKFRSILTVGVTANPAFKIRNIIRDTLTTLALADTGTNPVAGAKALIGKKSQTYASMLASGGLIRFGTMIEGNRSTHVDRLVNAGVKGGTIVDTKEKMLDMFQKGWDYYNELGDISENANRASVFQRKRDEVLKRELAAGKTQAEAEAKALEEAALMSRDLMDFSMGGSWGAVRFLTQTVPFMNARLQGGLRLYKGMVDNPARFGAVLGAAALASIILMLTYKDDDDWKKREDWDRDNYWWFKIGGVAYRIPKPFEIGAMATIAERGVELFASDEMTSKRFLERLKFAVEQTFAFNPVPQAFKPMMDIYSNIDSFTGRPIESMAHQNLPKSQRYSGRTHDVSKMLGAAGEYTGLSPDQIDHLVKGYFGWLGTAALVLSDAAMSPVSDSPAKARSKMRDWFLAGNFAEGLPADQSRYLTQLYTQGVEINEAYAAYRRLLKEGNVEGAREYMSEHRTEIAAHPALSSVQRQLSEINAAIRKVESSRSMGPDEKRTRLNLFYSKRNALAQRAQKILAPVQ